MELEELLKGPKRTEKGGGATMGRRNVKHKAHNGRNAIVRSPKRERGSSWRPRRKEKRPDDRRGRKKRKENVTTW